MFVRTLVTAAGPRARHRPLAGSYLRQSISADRRHTAWSPVTLRERAAERWQTCGEEETKPPGTSESLAFPCERADHLEVSCSERYPRPRPSSNDSENSFSTECGQTVETMCTAAGRFVDQFVIGSGLRVASVETCWTAGLIYFVWLYMSQSQALIQA